MQFPGSPPRKGTGIDEERGWKLRKGFKRSFEGAIPFLSSLVVFIGGDAIG